MDFVVPMVFVDVKKYVVFDKSLVVEIASERVFVVLVIGVLVRLLLSLVKLVIELVVVVSVIEPVELKSGSTVVLLVMELVKPVITLVLVVSSVGVVV